MIMGDTCTRACAFCDVKTGKPTSLDIFEPAKISSAVKNLEFKNSLLSDQLDLDYVEILIRKKFLFGKDGETLYIINKNDN
jgi:hypothetical protein